MKYLASLLTFIVFFTSIQAHAIAIIRDTEVENLMNSYVRKTFKAAGLDPQNAEVILVNDNSINAFVAGGQTIFVHTGLITTAKSVDDVMFVLAHETGHIVGGHVIRGMEQYKNAQTTALISTVLGGLVALAGGRPDAGIAVMAGGQGSALGMFLAYRQTEESAADRTAVEILNKTGYSLIGFSNTMKQIQQIERMNTGTENSSYLRTHPLTQNRIRDMERFVSGAHPTKQDQQFDLVKAKLTGFLYPPAETRIRYKGNTLADKYALAIAMYRDKKIPQSLKKIDELIAIQPNNPFFHELKGQFLFETGQIEQAIKSYNKAVALLPNAPLIRLSLGQALTESDQKTASTQAIEHLTRVTQQDPYIPIAWRLLAVAYGKTNNTAMADYAMAEYYMLVGNTKDARRLAERAQKGIKPGTTAYQHIEDILSLSEKDKSKKDNW